MQCKFFPLILPFLWAFMAPSYAITYEWTGNTDENFADPTNWSPNGVPGASDNIILNLNTCYIQDARTINKITLNGGTLSGPGSLIVNDDFEWVSGTVVMDGDITVNDDTFIFGAADKNKGGDGNLKVAGDGVWDGGTILFEGGLGSILVPFGKTLFVSPTAALEAHGNSSSNRFSILGDLNLNTAQILTLDTPLKVATAGRVFVAAGATLQLAGDSDSLAGTFNFNGTLEMADGYGDQIVFTSTAQINGLAPGGNFVTSSPTLTATIDDGATFAVRGLILNDGGIILNTPATIPFIDVHGGGIGGSSNPIVTGNVDFTAGRIGPASMTINGTTSITGNEEKTVSGTNMMFNGPLNWTGGNFAVTFFGLLTISSGVVFTVNPVAGSSITTNEFPGAIINSGIIRKPTNSTVTFGIQTNNSSTGLVEGFGTLLGAINDGTISPGLSPGTLSLSYFGTTDVVNIEIASNAGPGTGHDQLIYVGNAALSGILNVLLINNFVPATGSTYTIATANLFFDAFTTVNFPAPASNWSITYNPTSVVVTYLGPLPVELIRLDARAEGRQVHLYWQTASESDNRGFEVQRAAQAHPNDWQTIGWVESQSQAGSGADYDFWDKKPLEGGTCYYRLRQIDKNNAFQYSPVVAVQIGAGNTLQITPNLVRGGTSTLVRAALPEGHVCIQIISADGRLAYEQHGESDGAQNSLLLETGHLAPGIYFVRTVAPDASVPGGWLVIE